MRHLEAQLEEKNQELQRVCVLQTASVHFSFASIVLHYVLQHPKLPNCKCFVCRSDGSIFLLHHLSTLTSSCRVENILLLQKWMYINQ